MIEVQSELTMQELVSRAITPNVLILVYEQGRNDVRRCVDVRWEPLPLALSIAEAEREQLRCGMISDTSSPDEIPD